MTKKAEFNERADNAMEAIQSIYNGLPHASKAAYAIKLEIVLAFIRHPLHAPELEEDAQEHKKVNAHGDKKHK